MSKWSEETLHKASEVWKSGGTYLDVCPVLGTTKRRFVDLCVRRRDLFPARDATIPQNIVDQASLMWKAGDKQELIRERLGVSQWGLTKLIVENKEDKFPARWRTKDGFTFVEPQKPKVAEPQERRLPKIREDQMRWVTIQGAYVTLPKISFIECPRAAA